VENVSAARRVPNISLQMANFMTAPFSAAFWIKGLLVASSFTILNG
jgi:hypothetical protein